MVEFLYSAPHRRGTKKCCNLELFQMFFFVCVWKPKNIPSPIPSDILWKGGTHAERISSWISCNKQTISSTEFIVSEFTVAVLWRNTWIRIISQFYCQSKTLLEAQQRERARERRLEERNTTLKDKERWSQAWRSQGAAVESCSSEKFWTSNRLLPLVYITAQQLPGGWNMYTADRSDDLPCSVAHM